MLMISICGEIQLPGGAPLDYLFIRFWFCLRVLSTT